MMFRQKSSLSYSHDDICELIDDLLTQPDNNHIVKLLEATLEFINSSPTNRDMMIARNKSITDDKIKKIVDSIGNALEEFNKLPEDKFGNTIYERCCETIKERMEALKDKDDKIFIYYKQNDNPLKSCLNVNHSKELKNN